MGKHTSRSWLQRVGSRLKIMYYRFMGIEIGRDTFISFKANLDVRRGKVVVGKNVEIERETCVLSHTGYQEVKEGEQTVIEDNVKILIKAVILPGVKIGKNSVVGAGSIVMRDVPPNVYVFGNPAKVVEKIEPKI
jgi:2,3,4,5-tetrahydropyridine-2-carboxylate N-succinyltransferase